MSPRESIRHTDVWALLLFLLTAASGVWIAGGQDDAWFKFCMLVGALAVYGIVALIPEQFDIRGRGRFAPLSLLFGMLPVLVTAYFLLTNDWARWIGRLPGLDPVVQWFAAWRPTWGHSLNPNVAGGVLAVLLPLQLAALRGADPLRHIVWVRVLWVGISGLGLLMTLARGAWLALAIVAGAWGLWNFRGWLTRRWGANQKRAGQWAIRILTLLIPGLVCVLALLLMPGASRLRALVEADRLEVWRTSLDLLSDYPFTGLGLANFQMAHASYVLLLHVGHTFHAHNLFLDLWLEQGLLGLLAFLWLVVNAALPAAPTSPWRPAALAALGVVLLYGLVDDPLYGEGGLAVLVLFVPVALLARSEPVAALQADPLPVRRSYVAFLASVLAVFLLVSLFVPAIQAAFEANLGALIQTRAELPVYRWPEWPIQDALRRSLASSLAPAIGHYEAALALDPANATANRRLGQIELSLGQYDSACRHLQQAYRTAPDQRATRQLLGECYAIAGDITQASALWRTVDISRGQLTIRQWWYEHLGEKERAEWIQQATRMLH